jgi:hypothetical protein
LLQFAGDETEDDALDGKFVVLIDEHRGDAGVVAAEDDEAAREGAVEGLVCFRRSTGGQASIARARASGPGIEGSVAGAEACASVAGAEARGSGDEITLWCG